MFWGLKRVSAGPAKRRACVHPVRTATPLERGGQRQHGLTDSGIAPEGPELFYGRSGTGVLRSGDLTTADDPLLALDPCSRRSGISSLTSFASNKLGKSPAATFSSVGIEGKEGGEVVEGVGASQSTGGRLRAAGSTAPSWMDDEVRRFFPLSVLYAPSEAALS